MKKRINLVSNSSSSSFILNNLKFAQEVTDSFETLAIQDIVNILFEEQIDNEYRSYGYSWRHYSNPLELKGLPDGEYIARFIKGDAHSFNSIYYPESLEDLFESYHRLQTDEKYYKSMSNDEKWDKISELEEAITIGLVNLLTIYFPGEFTEAYEIEGADDHSTDPTEEELREIYSSYDGWKIWKSNH